MRAGVKIQGGDGEEQFFLSFLKKTLGVNEVLRSGVRGRKMRRFTL